LVGEKQKFDSLITQLNQCRKSILKQADSLQNVIDGFRNILTPVQTGKFLVLLDRHRNRKEFSAEKLWETFGSKKENDEESDFNDHFLEDTDDGLEEEDSDPSTNEGNNESLN